MTRRWMRARTLLALAGALAGCQTAQPPPPSGNNVCQLPSVSVPLTSDLHETSGVAASRQHEGVFWTHNDSGGDPALFAIDSTGRILKRIRVLETHNRDWEDIALGPCEPGGPDCLFIGEIGDNNERHPHVAVYRIPEPDPAGDTLSDPARIFRFTYPDGPRDAESLFVTEQGIHVVSKGRSHAIELFRLPPPYQHGETVQIHRVQRLLPPPTSASFQATAAAADPAGERVVLRTYGGLRFYRVVGDTLAQVGRAADLVAPEQLQGEAVDFLSGDRLVLTSEARGTQPASLAILSCDPLRPPDDTLETGP